MLPPILDALQLILIPLAIGLVIVAAVAAFLAGRRRGPTWPTAAPGVPAAESAPQALDDSSFGAPATAVRAEPPTVSARPSLPLAADLLLVDDSAVARAKLRRLFEAAGYQVQLARDGVEALALLDKGRYALMITDLEMPNLDGVELISACMARPQTAGMPILAITGHDDLQAKLNECHTVCGIYRKPWIDDDLSGHVAALVSTRSARQAEVVDA